jgi:hypothetical protein
MMFGKFGDLFSIQKYVALIEEGKKMKDWKTTLSGSLGILVTIGGWFGIPIGPDVIHAVQVISVFAVGFFSKDKSNGNG